eukprot:m.44114 g.44114  ORF g.44114 m.44114 type:complete len:319 (-) comp15076_c1_seq6:389-1345(-)
MSRNFSVGFVFHETTTSASLQLTCLRVPLNEQGSDRPRASIRSFTIASVGEQVKSSLMMMGVRRSHHWMAWFLYAIIPLSVSVIITGLLVHSFSIFAADASVTIVFLLLWALNIVAFIFIISTLFQKAANAAMASGGLLYFTFMPFQLIFQIAIQSSKNPPGKHAQMGLCFLPGSCMGVGTYVFAMFEELQQSVSWSNIATVPGDNIDMVSMADVLFMLAFDFVWLSTLAVYIDQVYPGEQGVPRPLLFPLYDLISLVRGGTGAHGAMPQGLSINSGDYDKGASPTDPDKVEAMDPSLPVGVALTALTKKFPPRGLCH